MDNPQKQAARIRIDSRREKVSELYLRGASQWDIAHQLEIDQATVSRDLTALRKEWLERSINHIDQKKAIELAKLDRLEVTYWEAWERSKKNAEKMMTEQLGAINNEGGEIIGTRVRQVKTVEGQSGNPAFLDGVLKCIAKRCEILGLDAPKVINNRNLDLSKLNEDQLRRLRDGEDVNSILAA